MNQSGQILIQPPSPVALHFISLFFRSRRLFCVRLPRPLCVLSFFTSFASFVFLFSFSSLRSFPPSSCFVPFPSFIHSFFFSLFLLFCVTFFLLSLFCLFVHSFPPFVSSSSILFLFFIQSHLLCISFASFVYSHLLFCSVSFLFVGSLAPSFILFGFFRSFAPSSYFFLRLFTLPFLHSHLVSILFFPFVYSHLLSILFHFFHSFAPSFFYVSFLCCVPHLLYPVYFLRSFTPSFYFERFANSIVLPLLCCVDSFRHCFCVVYFLTPFAPPVCSPVRLPLFENPSSKQRKFR